LAFCSFFLAHAVESSIIGLELIFEHRNYLPSLFIFFPVAAGIKWVLDYYRDRKRTMHAVIVSFVTLLIMGLGIGTYVRNIAWASEKTLWEDALQKAPNSKRPYHNLAWGYYWKIGLHDKAIEMYEKSLSFQTHSGISQARAINNIGNIHFIKSARPGRSITSAISISSKETCTKPLACLMKPIDAIRTTHCFS
jgi:tetratricopeptide (TPR) repeat protein